jgi:RND superfamily putative drug exporter
MNVDALFGALGRFSVRFRWSMLLAWIVAAVAASAALPSLSSVTQSDNTKFLPAGAPVEKAATLAAPFGTTNLLPVPLIAARQTGPLTTADAAALATLQRNLKSDPSVVRVLDLGQSPTAQDKPGQANQLLVLVHQLGGDPNASTKLIGGLRAKIRQTARPAGLQVHLAGAFAVQVDQQKANGNQGGQIELYSSLLIVLILVLIFRSLTLALVTLFPALISVVISGPLVAEAAQHGLKVSPIAQFLMIVLVLGAPGRRSGPTCAGRASPPGRPS